MDGFDGNVSLTALRQQFDPECFACGPANRHDFGFEFRLTGDGTVESSFACRTSFAGYPGILHGGVICTLLDGAMTNCLFAHGLAAVTVEMKVRFRRPVAVDSPATVRPWRDTDGSPVHHLAAELRQDGRVAATATARFIERRTMSWF